MSKDKEQLEKIESLMSSVEDQSQQIKQLISKDNEQSEKPPQRERPVPINQILPTPFEWEIPNIMSQNLVSKPFYLFERGYKYLLQIKTLSKGWQMNVRVLIKVVPGEFDELLSWPCKEKVRVAWVNQDEPFGKYYSDVTDFEKGSEPCCRPLNDDHHAYRPVLGFTVAVMDTISIRVNRE